MNGVPIGILIMFLLVVVPPVIIWRAKYANPKQRLIWFVVSLLGIPIGLLWKYIDMQRVLSAPTDVEKAKLLVSMPPLANLLFMFWAITALILFKIFNSTNKNKDIG